jgi:hypothetical protein
LPFHTVDDAKVLRGANTADILLTMAWPKSIRTGSKVLIPESTTEPPNYDHISELCQTLKPRYHFSCSQDYFYEREPYFHAPSENAPNERPLTRFVSLAAHGNPSKQKALYAFNLQASPDHAAPLPIGTTSSPFAPSRQKRQALDPAPYSRFSNGEDGPKRRFRGGRRERQPPPGPDSCYFCLSNPNIGTHLVASIGDDAYLTTAKGPLTTSTTNAQAGIDFPAHMLIIPLTHEPTLALIPEADARDRTYLEMSKYKASLQNMISIRSANKLGSVTYEISRANGVHTHWQFIPMPADLVRKGVVEAAFQVEAENSSYPKFATRDVGLGEKEGDFFRVWIWSPPSDDEDGNEGTTKCLLLPLDDDTRFDLQFGRRVLAKLLGLEKRLQWRDCDQPLEDEKNDVDAFKAAFKEYDFTT